MAERWRIGDECGRPWYRLSSWRLWNASYTKRRWDFSIRRGLGYFAIGPIMVWKEKNADAGRS